MQARNAGIIIRAIENKYMFRPLVRIYFLAICIHAGFMRVALAEFREALKLEENLVEV